MSPRPLLAWVVVGERARVHAAEDHERAALDRLLSSPGRWPIHGDGSLFAIEVRVGPLTRLEALEHIAALERPRRIG